MLSDHEVREVVKDAHAYLQSRAWWGVVDVLGEERDAVRAQDWGVVKAVEMLDVCAHQLWLDKSPAEAAAALELLFHLARGRTFDDRDVDPAIFERYTRARALTGSSTIPLTRATPATRI